MAITYPTCSDGVGDLTYTSDACRVPEMGNVRSIMLIKKGNTVTFPLTKLTIENMVNAKTMIIIPETKGSFDGGTPVVVQGYGDVKERKSGDDYVLQIKDPNYTQNLAFWSAVEKQTWNIAFRSDTMFHLVTADVTITAKAPIEEDNDSQVVWNAEAKWFSKTKPTMTPVAPIKEMLVPLVVS